MNDAVLNEVNDDSNGDILVTDVKGSKSIRGASEPAVILVML